MNVSLDCFRYFKETARLQNINLAAKSLHISPSAISNAILSLEAQYETRLFDRVGRNIVLNENGKILQDKITKILDQVEGLQTQFRSPQKKESFSGYLSLGGSFYLAEKVLSTLLIEFQKSQPHLRTEVSPLRTSQLREEILQGKINYGIGLSVSKHPELFIKTLYSGKMVLVASKKNKHKNLLKKSISLLDLNEIPAAFHKSAAGVDTCEEHPLFEKFHLKPKITHSFHSDTALIELLKKGASFWALIPDLIANHYQKEIRILNPPTDFSIPYELNSVRLNVKKEYPLYHYLDERIKQLLIK